MRSKWMTAGVLAGALTLALAGCTGAEDPEPTPTPSATEEAEQTPGVTDVQDVPGSGEGWTGALQDLEVTTCERGDEGWTVDGTVTNPTEGAVTYRIYMSLLDGETETRALQQVNVDTVEAGQSAEWSMTIPVDDEGLTCVPRVERYEA